MYAKACSQPKSTPATKKEPPNQAHTRKPCADTQKSSHAQDNANQPKQSRVHTTDHNPQTNCRADTAPLRPTPSRAHKDPRLPTQSSPSAEKATPLSREHVLSFIG